MANIGTIVGGGFALIRRRPGAVLAWGAIYTVASAALGYGQLRLVGPLDPAVSGQAALEGLTRGVGVQLLFGVLSMVLSAVLSAAVFRAVLWPQDRGMASIRLGMDEARLIGLTLIVYVLSGIVGVVGVLGFAFLTTLVGFVFGGSPAVSGVFATLVIAGVMALALVLLVRLSVVYPLVLVRRRISLDAGWELTRGHFWSLLGAYMLAGLAMMVPVTLALFAFAAIIGGSSFSSATFWPMLFQRMTGGEAQMPLVFVAVLAVASLLTGLVLAVSAGSAAAATKDLLARGQAAPVPEAAPLD
jgi:hypothetical protein